MEKVEEHKFHLSYVVTLAFAHFFHDTFSSFLSPILPLLIKNLGLSFSLAALLSVFQKIPSLLNPFIGIVADRLPLTYFIIITPLVTAVTMSLLPVSSSYLLLALLLLTMGISASFFHVPAPVLMRNVSGKRIGAGMSFFMFGGELARSVGPLVILGAISLWGIKGTFRLIPFGIAASLFLYFRLKSIPAHLIIDKKEIEEEKKYLSSLVSVLKRHRKLFIIITGIVFTKSIIASAFTAFLPTYLTSGGSSLWLAGVSLSVLELAGAAGTFVSGSFSDLIGRKRMLLLIMVLSPVFMLLFLFSHGFLILPSLVLLGFSIFSVTPVIMALVQDSEKEYPASANGIYMTLNFVLNSIVIMIIGILGDKIGLENTYKLCLVLSLPGIPFVLMLDQGKRSDKGSV
ncbi:MAG: MFS transporter [Spirochaetes bacterium]|nr:MFS transporter [Spirochaetota bacterium]